MNLLESAGEVCGCWIGSLLSKFDFKIRMIAKVSIEQRLLSGRVGMIIKRKFSQDEVVDPIILLIQGIGTSIGFKGFVRSFSEVIGLRMESSGWATFLYRQET